jgi:uncharacterized protein
MTEQEQQLISRLAERIKNAPPQQVDRDAYDLILHTIGTRPDALYLLTQIVIMQEMALNHAQSQGSFLPRQQPPPAYQESRYQDSSYAAPPPPPPPPQGGGLSGFLHNAAQTAAGVIAGEIAFDSIASIFGHRGGGLFGGGGFFGGGGGGYPSETIINNNYGDDRGDDRRDRGDDTRFADAASQNQDVSSDIDDERDNSGDSFSDDGSSSTDDDGS